MKSERKFYRCPLCGNLISFVEYSGAPVECCGQPMEELKPNTADAAQEKHVPVAAREGGDLKVAVGSAPHPMTAEHSIAWIAVAQQNRTARVTLQPGAAPAAEFCGFEGPVTVYAYCNLHGLWAAEL